MYRLKTLSLALGLMFCECFSATAQYTTRVEYRQMSWNGPKKQYVSYSDIVQDCDMLKYLVETSYAGYGNATSQGFKLTEAIKQIEDSFSAEKSCPSAEDIPIDDFAMQISISLGMIKDMHFSILGNRRFRLNTHYDMYFSDVYVKKTNDDYTVFMSKDDRVKTGDAYTGDATLLYPYPAMGENVYRIGMLSYIPLLTIGISVNSGSVAVWADKGKPIPSRELWTNSLHTADSAYISCGSFNNLADTARKKRNVYKMEFYMLYYAHNAREKKNIIVDLRGNKGGSGELSNRFLSLLFFPIDTHYAKNYQHFVNMTIVQNIVNLYSPAILQASIQSMEKQVPTNFIAAEKQKKALRAMQENPIRRLSGIKQQNVQLDQLSFPDGPGFPGTLFIITDRNSASAAEALVASAALFCKSKAVTIGENTVGCITYCNPVSYSLPKSGIEAFIPATKFFNPMNYDNPYFHGETKGFYPDYWSTNPDLLKTLINLTNDKELETKLKGLGSGML